MKKQTEPVIILAGTSYPGEYKKDVFAHVLACIRERTQLERRSDGLDGRNGTCHR
jgi:hypothetical protein